MISGVASCPAQPKAAVRCSCEAAFDLDKDEMARDFSAESPIGKVDCHLKPRARVFSECAPRGGNGVFAPTYKMDKMMKMIEI